jgi:hypothetical protein
MAEDKQTETQAKKKKVVYRATKAVQDRPRKTTWNGQVYAIGGDGVKTQTPPKEDIIHPECTDQKVLKALFEAGWGEKGLIEKVEE